MAASITGMAMITPWGSLLEEQIAPLRNGRSALANWEFGYSQVGAPLAPDVFDRWLDELPRRIHDEARIRKLSRLLRGAAFAARVGTMAAVEAMLQAGYSLFPEPDETTGVIVCGHQFQSRHLFDNHTRFIQNPESIDPLLGLTSIDTYVGSVVSELFNLQGPCMQVGAACASGNMGLMAALDIIRASRAQRVLVVAPPCEMHAMGLHSWVMLDAIVFRSFQSDPAGASRPFDPRREGFVPSQCAAAMVLENGGIKNGRRLAQLSGAAANSSANRQTQPSEQRAVSLMLAACEDAKVAFSELSAINAHATSTPVGDAVEAAAIRKLAGLSIPVQATKSLLGHSLSASALVEAVVSVLQIRHSFLHPSINLTEDHELGIDLVLEHARTMPLRHILSNAFGFGGLNAAVVISE
jgi:3-oxoacyl-(acyl-carrier-protein) synthase